MKKAILLILLIVVSLAGFGIYKLVGTVKRGGERGDAAMAQFHERYNAGKDAEIYELSSKDFKALATFEKLQQETATLRATLGKFLSTSRTGVNVNNTNGSTTLEMGCTSTFEKGTAAGTFTFDYNSDTPLLRGFHYKDYKLNTPAGPTAVEAASTPAP